MPFTRMLAAGIATALALVWAPAAQAAPTTDWFWEWSDGSRARDRTIEERWHPRWTTMPALRVASSPAASGRLVELQVRSGDAWHTEDSTRSDASGAAVLQVNPYCADGGWCAGVLRYRLRVEGSTASLTIRFTPERPSP